MVNFANAIGYAKWSITQTKTGNSCQLTWLDANGAFQTANGDTTKALPYVIDFTNCPANKPPLSSERAPAHY